MSGVIEDENRCKKMKDHIKELENTVKSLEINMKRATRTDNKIVMSFQKDKIKYQGITNQLEEALKENQQLLNILHKNTDGQDLSRTSSLGDLSPSCSTMSMVHLQYKYEELLANHHGLLKLLEMKSDEIKKVFEENIHLKTEIEQLKIDLSESQDKITKYQTKFFKLKNRKDGKINKLKTHKEALQIAHNQLSKILHNKCMEKDSLISDEIRNSSDSEKALLLQEIRKNYMLEYDNFQLNQQLEYLRSLLNARNKLEKQCSMSFCLTLL